MCCTHLFNAVPSMIVGHAITDFHSHICIVLPVLDHVHASRTSSCAVVRVLRGIGSVPLAAASCRLPLDQTPQATKYALP